MIAGLVLSLMTALPLAWKWQLGVLRASVVISAFAAVSALLVGSMRNAVAIGDWIAAGAVWLLSVGATVALLAYRFYRDPERQAPDRRRRDRQPGRRRGDLRAKVRRGDAAGLGQARPPVPARRAHQDQLHERRCRLHRHQHELRRRAREPIAGRGPRHVFAVTFPGCFGSLRKPEMLFENERATTVIERDGLQVAVVQIASRLVRQISVFLREGEPVALSQRLGVIRFGSQVDVVLPARSDVRITAQVGERLRAGESIIAVLENRRRRPRRRRSSRASERSRDAGAGRHRHRRALSRPRPRSKPRPAGHSRLDAGARRGTAGVDVALQPPQFPVAERRRGRTAGLPVCAGRSSSARRVGALSDQRRDDGALRAASRRSWRRAFE